MSYFSGKGFLVTGASSGIGRDLALGLAREGAIVAAMARSEGKLTELAASAPAGRVLPVVGDVASDESTSRAVESAVNACGGRLDGLIHSAGISMSGRVEDVSLDVFREVMETNFFSTIRLVKAALPHIRQQRGHIVAISSIAGFVSYPFGSGYAASKHALQALLDSLRLELAPAGVHVLSVCPGYVRTDIAKNARRADGSKWEQSTKEIENGLDPAVVTRATLRAIEARKRQIAPAGLMEASGKILKPLAPGLLDAVMLKMYARGPLDGA
ncbi:MAG: SDR family oxidoreductase [Candidatus Sericytochromatia bacterium]|uniref:SDR family oxidoreductase n=1 Tax=Candidatus Tanganyikabacteria bacterium TaxID=2961651 RepID=A0A937X3N4_9BACT|nr:SDR family oxidoreductase [Candidatus Tanganyikabacteria bacterium]